MFIPSWKGQGLLEYAMLIVLVAVVVIILIAILGTAFHEDGLLDVVSAARVRPEILQQVGREPGVTPEVVMWIDDRSPRIHDLLLDLIEPCLMLRGRFIHPELPFVRAAW